MLFRIKQASGGWTQGSSPCDGAQSIANKYGGNFYWGIEIGSVEDLLALAEKEKRSLIVCAAEKDEPLPSIIIYDDYVE